MFIQFKTELEVQEWITHNNKLVGYNGEGKTKTLTNPVEGVDGWYLSLASERWNGEGLAEPLELLDGAIIESFERIIQEEN